MYKREKWAGEPEGVQAGEVGEMAFVVQLKSALTLC